MKSLNSMAVFSQVIESNGFSAAARRLGVTKAAVSRQVSALEAELNVRLLNRTTRRLNLTEPGRLYYESCKRILEEAERAERLVRNLQDEPTGSLRISGPIDLNNDLAVFFADFALKYPRVRLDVELKNRYVDLVREGFDVAIRAGDLADSSLIARRLSPLRVITCASPKYLAEHGTPQTPDELLSHDWLAYSLLSTPDRYVFTKEGKSEALRFKGRIRTNDGAMLRTALCRGVGLTQLPYFVVRDEIESGELVQVLDDYATAGISLYAVFPQTQHLSQKVRLLIEYLAACFAKEHARY